MKVEKLASAIGITKTIATHVDNSATLKIYFDEKEKNKALQIFSESGLEVVIARINKNEQNKTDYS